MTHSAETHVPTGSLAPKPFHPPSDPALNFARHDADRIGTQGTALLGLTGFLLAWLLSHTLEITAPNCLLLLFLGLTSLPMAAASLFILRVHLRPSSGLDGIIRPLDWKRCGIKFLGLSATLAGLALAYWLIPEYRNDSYTATWRTVEVLVMAALIAALPYIAWVDRRMSRPQDGYWHCGLFFLGQWQQVDWKKLKKHALGWAIKGFFFPFMFSGMVAHLDTLEKYGVQFNSFAYLYETGLNFLLTVDVVFGALGYLLTLRILDAQIKSPEPTCLGWVSAIICYAPFSTFVWTSLLPYKGKIDWADWLAPHPLFFITWGFVILLLNVVYVWSTCSFGCRFSNLTNRGIIVDGPYRYVKHPAYLSKNIAWWLISVPFVAHSPASEAFRACVLLALTNAIYFVRAITEERHLKADPAYVAYSNWMDHYGMAAQLRRLLPWRRWRASRSFQRIS